MPPPAAAKKPTPIKAPTTPCQPDRYAEPGMVVLHYPDLADDCQPNMMVVTRVGIDSIDGMILHPNMGSAYPYSGVHHRKYQADRIGSDGHWTPQPMNLAILEFLIETGRVVWDGESRYVPKTKPEPKTQASSPPPPPVTA